MRIAYESSGRVVSLEDTPILTIRRATQVESVVSPSDADYLARVMTGCLRAECGRNSAFRARLEKILANIAKQKEKVI